MLLEQPAELGFRQQSTAEGLSKKGQLDVLTQRGGVDLSRHTMPSFQSKVCAGHGFHTANALPTAEGAVQIALEELPVTLHGARALVLGYGRVGKLTAHRLAALGAQVTVAARSYEALAWAEAYGHAAQQLSDLSGYLCGYDLVVNTVPRRVLTRELLEELKEGCLVIDLASKPGGVDFQSAAELGVRCVWALSLPGKVAPVTVASALRDTIYNMLREYS